jgi:hypothetical protein
MTAAKVWEYRHPVSNPDGATVFKYSNSQGMAQRLENGNTLVLFGSDIDPVTFVAKNPQTFTLVEADSSSAARALAVLDMKVPGDPILYRVLPITTIFGESPVQPSRYGNAHGEVEDRSRTPFE